MVTNSCEKVCPQCEAQFTCCAENCWCATLPQIMPLTVKGACLCPKCLQLIVDQKLIAINNDLAENIEYYINAQGNWVFTALYHLKRGTCCENDCKHCPY